MEEESPKSSEVGAMSIQDSVSFFLSQGSRGTSKDSNWSPKDDAETVDMEASEDGVGIEEDEFGYLTRHPSKRRKRHANKMSLYILLAFCFVMFFALVPLSRRKKKEQKNFSETMSQSAKMGGNPHQGNGNSGASVETKVFCNGDRTPYSVEEWLDTDFRMTTTADLCDPRFQTGNDINSDAPSTNTRRRVKVFILFGESNMVGTGQLNGDVEGTLDYTVLQKKRFTHLVEYDKQWRRLSDVKYVAVNDNMKIERDEWLGVNTNHEYFGPELQFGYVMGEMYDEPVLLLKVASGHHSLGGDFLPPGSPAYEYGGWKYAGYGQSPRRWPVRESPNPNPSWYAGHGYDRSLSNIKSTLDNIGDFYPGATEYAIEGIALWHGDSDRRDTAYAVMYQRNLRNLIDSLRVDLGVPEAKVAIASIGQLGDAMQGNAQQVFDSQLSMGYLYKDFQDNVMSVDIRSSWRGPFLPGHAGDKSMTNAAHYGNNAETVMEVGNALGLAMAKLVRGRV